MTGGHNANIKLCKDCKYAVPLSAHIPEPLRCFHPENLPNNGLDLVHGRHHIALTPIYSCAELRSLTSFRCGTNARWFERKAVPLSWSFRIMDTAANVLLVVLWTIAVLSFTGLITQLAMKMWGH